MKKAAVILFSFLMFCIFLPVRADEDAAQRLYQEGIFQMEAMGDFIAAIKLFEKLVSEHPENKPLASRALLMAGRCYEKMGLEEAEKAYNRILEDYGDQDEMVHEARARLLALSERVRLAGYRGMMARKLWQGAPGTMMSSISADENYFVSSTHELFLDLVDLASGEGRRLMDNKAELVRGWFPVFSPDGKYLAYSWYGENLSWILSILNLESGAVSLHFEDEDWGYIQAFDWSPDGQAIALTLHKDEGTVLCLYHIEEGILSRLKAFDGYLPFNAHVVFSPNGRYLAYDHFRDASTTRRNIHVIDLESKVSYEVVSHPSDNVACGWTADGKQLVFISDRTGANAAWSLAVEGGEAAGAPVLLKSDIGQSVTPVRLSRSGSLYYTIASGGSDVYAAPFGPGRAEPFGAPVKISLRYQGLNRTAAFSPDGRYIAHTASRQRREVNFSNAVIIHDTETGRELSFLLDVQLLLDFVRWSPGGQYVVVRALYMVGRQRHYSGFILDAATGQVTDTIEGGPTGFVIDPLWSPDGNTMYFLRGDYSDMYRVEFVRRNMESGEESLLFDPDESREGLGSGSPSFRLIGCTERDMLAFSRSSRSEGRSGLFMLDPGADKPEPVLLLATNAPEVISRPLSFEGNRVLFIKNRLDEHNIHRDPELWSVDIVSGEVRKIADIPEEYHHFSLHPDGKTALFNLGSRMNEIELWVIDNLLP